MYIYFFYCSFKENLSPEIQKTLKKAQQSIIKEIDLP